MLCLIETEQVDHKIYNARQTKQKRNIINTYPQWYLRMCFLLCSKDLLDVCEKAIGQDATPSTINQWTKLSFEAITTITSRINCRVFLEVINTETSDKANILWSKINKQYASKRAMNKGCVWMNWQKANESGNINQYIKPANFFLN
ncbi:hypothetical protein O181_035644 [Austropuccinia psidii MF-1]|uniref:Uncharacterized protein n=1 Tax=Austropuccinia psidii MF-1 TaxID=1389203 RepID=A0A9Q3D353_9BASI|nr:hypothetical protein [Austropuccinia psidii MF-1]